MSPPQPAPCSSAPTERSSLVHSRPSSFSSPAASSSSPAASSSSLSAPASPQHAHHHSHHHSHSHSHTDPHLTQHARELNTLTYACALTTFFFFIELAGGYFASSLAIMSDAAHLLSDLAGFLISLIAVSVSRLPANSCLSFGFSRTEVLGAFVSIFFIWALTILLLVFSVIRLFNPTPVNGPLMLSIGIIGLVVNIILTMVLGHSHHDHSHQHSHHHDEENPHSHSHSHEPFNLKRFISALFGSDIQSVTVRAAYLHAVGDLLQSIGVIIAAIIICFDHRLSFVDPLCTILFAVLVIMTTAGLAKETIIVLMEGTPPSIDSQQVYNHLLQIDGVFKVGDLHIWSISPRRPALSVHVYGANTISPHELLIEIQQMLSDQFSIKHATIQINCDSGFCCCNNETYLGTPAQRKRCLTFHDVPSSSFDES